MALPTSGRLGLRDISNEFGGSGTLRLSDYYKGGQYVTTGSDAPNVPASGLLKISDFYGASAVDGTWLTEPGVVYNAVPKFIDMPPGWHRGTVRGVVNNDGILYSATPPSVITDSENVHTVAMDINMSPAFAYSNGGHHFVLGSRHPDRDYNAPPDNRCGAVIGGGIFRQCYYGIEGVEVGDATDPTGNTHPWNWSGIMLPDMWWRVVIITQYASWGSSMKAMLFDSAGAKVVDTGSYSILPNSNAFSRASVQHGIVIAIIFDGTPDQTYRFRNVRSYWSQTLSGVPTNP